MKKLLLITFLFVFVSTSYGQKENYVTFQAEITNRNNDFLNITSLNGQLLKKIVLNEKGVFKDTLKVQEGKYLLNDGKELTEMFLKNGFSIKIKLDAKKFDESIVYTGNGALENNTIAKRFLRDEKYYGSNFLELEEQAFEKFINDKREMDLKLFDNKKLNPSFVESEKANMENNLMNVGNYYQKNHGAAKLNNTMSPSFDYVNHKGGNSKLEDFSGKYVYIDIWATWCGPCRAEIPHLQKIEEEYHDKNIAFVSISIDEAKDFEKWKSFVSDKKLGGIQLFADKDWNSDFIRKFGVTGIPRFILVDPTGKIVKANAARPSDPELRKLLNELLP